MKLQITIKRNLDNPTTHTDGVVVSRGRVYACTWAGAVTVEKVRETWLEDRRAFRPFDETSGQYL